MFGLSIWELLIILAIVLLLFGTKRLKNMGSDLGDAIKGFRSAVTEEDQPEPKPDPKIIDGEVAAQQRNKAQQNSERGA